MKDNSDINKKRKKIGKNRTKGQDERARKG